MLWVPGVKWLQREAHRSPPSSSEINNAWSYTATPPYVLVSLYVNQHSKCRGDSLGRDLPWNPFCAEHVSTHRRQPHLCSSTAPPCSRMMERRKRSRIVTMVTVMVRRGVEHVVMVRRCGVTSHTSLAPSRPGHTRFILHHAHHADETVGLAEQLGCCGVAQGFQVAQIQDGAPWWRTKQPFVRFTHQTLIAATSKTHGVVKCFTQHPQ